jgi:hypothetical protein
MSQPATEPPARPRPQPAGGNILTRRMLGVPGWGWVAIVAVGAGIFIWWRSRKSSASSASTAAAATQSTCYDANGNAVDCSSPQAVGSNATDYFESLYTQDEGISNQLQTITPVINTTGTDVAQLLADQAGPPSTGTTNPGGPNQGTPGPVTDLTVDVVSPTLARVSWRPPQFASHAPTSTTYTIQIAPVDKAPHNIGSRTSYNVGGLHAGSHYTATVAPSGGPSSSKAFTTPGSAKVPPGAPVQPGGLIKKAA